MGKFKKIWSESKTLANNVHARGEVAIERGAPAFVKGISGKGHKPRKVGKFSNEFQGRIL